MGSGGDGGGFGVGFFQAGYREHGTRITVSSNFAMYSNAMGRGEGGCFYQTHSSDQGSLFLVIFAMYFNVIGREGTVLSDTS